MPNVSSDYNKFSIKAYEDIDFQTPVTPKSSNPVFGSQLQYQFPFNPSSLNINTLHNYNLTQPTGFTGINPRFVSIRPRKLTVSLVIDPGVEYDYKYMTTPHIQSPEAKLTLAQRIDIFDELVGYNNSSHRPNYLQLSWGESISFNAVLDRYDLEYQRFNQKGKPTKVLIQATFLESISTTEMLSEQDRQSPDISHSIEVKEGDTLASLCNKIYGDYKYYVDVATINGLDSIRSLEPGQRLYFPPLKD